MKQKLLKQDTGFAQVKNEVLADPNLSLKAKGLFAYLYSKPDNWDFSGHRMAQECKESKNTIFTVLKELENAGYLERHRLSTGKVKYNIQFQPSTKIRDEAQKPSTKKAQYQKSPVVKVGTITNTEKKLISKEQVINTSKAVALQGKQWNELIDGFKTINPLYEEFYRNTTERRALDYLVQKLGFEKVKNTIAHLSEITCKPYAPKISKPTELKRDLGKLIAFYNQEKNKSSPNKYQVTKIY